MATSSRSRSSKPLYKTKRWIAVTLGLILLSIVGTWMIGFRIVEKNEGTLPETCSGPWGELQIWDIRLEQPAEYRGFDHTSADRPFWFFGNLSQTEVENILRQSGCRREEMESLLNGYERQEDGKAIIKPDDATLRSLDPLVRSRLYLALANFPENKAQATPFFIPGGDLKRLLKGATFPPGVDVEALMKPLCYPRNGYTYFSDPEFVLRQIGRDPSQHDQLMKCLLSTNAVMGRVLVRPDSNIDTPVIYWGLLMPGVLVKDLYPLFESQRQLPQGGGIPLSDLLSPMARESLNKTPLPPKPGEKLPDCHWTALNFFNSKPDPRIIDPEFAGKYILENYYEIGRAKLACDLVLLLNTENKVAHSAVYLAGDLVYTKNGVNLGSPWVLMHLNDLIGVYSALTPVHAVFFRKKDY